MYVQIFRIKRKDFCAISSVTAVIEYERQSTTASTAVCNRLFTRTQRIICVRTFQLAIVWRTTAATTRLLLFSFNQFHLILNFITIVSNPSMSVLNFNQCLIYRRENRENISSE